MNLDDKMEEFCNNLVGVELYSADSVANEKSDLQQSDNLTQQSKEVVHNNAFGSCRRKFTSLCEEVEAIYDEEYLEDDHLAENIEEYLVDSGSECSDCRYGEGLDDSCTRCSNRSGACCPETVTCLLNSCTIFNYSDEMEQSAPVSVNKNESLFTLTESLVETTDSLMDHTKCKEFTKQRKRPDKRRQRNETFPLVEMPFDSLRCEHSDFTECSEPKLSESVIHQIKNSIVSNVIRCSGREDTLYFSGIHLKSSLSDTEKIYLNIFGRNSCSLRRVKNNGVDKETVAKVHALHNETEICDECGHIFDSPLQLLIHKKDHYLQYKEQLKMLEESVLRSYRIVDSSGKQTYKCDQCLTICRGTKYTFFEHYSSMHVTKQRVHVCKLCSMRVHNLRNHIRAVHAKPANKQFTCNICDRCFRSKRTLQYHSAVHTGDRLFSCNVCGKSFARKSTLIAHKEAEGGVKSYQCDLCGKAFCTKSTLTKHLQRHSTEKKYRCHVCGKSWSCKGYLYKHLKIHTELKPFKCEFCGACFKIKNYLRLHKKRKHGAITSSECETRL